VSQHLTDHSDRPTKGPATDDTPRLLTRYKLGLFQNQELARFDLSHLLSHIHLKKILPNVVFPLTTITTSNTNVSEDKICPDISVLEQIIVVIGSTNLQAGFEVEKISTHFFPPKFLYVSSCRTLFVDSFHENNLTVGNWEWAPSHP
jgi:hypothetical protein